MTDEKNFIDKLFDGEDDINDITEKIIGCAFKVSNTLGTGFLESVYENALVIEIRRTGLKVEQQKPLEVLYEDEIVGNFFADCWLKIKF